MSLTTNNLPNCRHLEMLPYRCRSGIVVESRVGFGCVDLPSVSIRNESYYHQHCLFHTENSQAQTNIHTCSYAYSNTCKHARTHAHTHPPPPTHTRTNTQIFIINGENTKHQAANAERYCPLTSNVIKCTKLYLLDKQTVPR